MVNLKKIFGFIGSDLTEETVKSPTSRIEPKFIRERGTFSQRIGYKKVEDEVQMSSMSKELRNGLWNVVVKQFFPTIPEPYSSPLRENKEFFLMIEKVWCNFFKFPADSILYDYVGNAINELRNSYMQLKWNEVYDFVEFLVQNNDSITSKSRDDFIQRCNEILEQESSYYRLVNGKITPQTSS